MAIQSSGPIRFSDLAAEFGDTAPHSFSEFYREGGKVPGVNSAVAASGAIRLGTFYNSVNELLQAVTANASINAQTIFGSDWGSAVPKRLSIPSGVVIGPLTIPAGLGGTLEVDVAGEVQGLSGSANSGAGGNAITANSSFTLNVLSGGAVRGGGGGGGVGGTGGGGRYSQTVTEGPYGPSGAYHYHYVTNSEGEFRQLSIVWAGQGVYQGEGGYSFSPTGNIRANPIGSALTRTGTQTVNTNGGSGGSGGVGRGYGQALTSGAGGSGGGTNAGTGGTGGTGGDWGTGGNTGNTGANGNRTGGAAGSGGGAAGRAVLMSAGTLTLNNSGTINGAY